MTGKGPGQLPRPDPVPARRPPKDPYPLMNPILAHDRVVAPDAHPQRWMFVLHGIYGAGRNWSAVARRFVKERPEWGVVLVDLRMHGDSRGFAPPHTLEACARDLRALAHHLGIVPEAVLGHSFGGKVALTYVRDADRDGGQDDGSAGPVRPPATVWVVDSTPSAREPDGSAWMMLEVLRRSPGPFRERSEGVAAVEAAFPTPVARWMATNLVPGPAGDLVWRLDPDVMDALLRDFFDTDAWRMVEDPPPGVRVHVIKAEESSVLDGDACARVAAAERATGGRVALHHVRGGHWVNADDPDGLHALLVEHTRGW